MLPEQGILQYYEDKKRAEGNTAAAEFTKVLREQFGDESFPQSPSLSTPPMYSPLEFVKAAIKEVAHLQKPKHQGLSEDNWIRQRNILGSLLISNKTQSEVAFVYGIAQGSVSQTAEKALKNLYENSSSELQARFRISKFNPIRRPKTTAQPIALPEDRPIHPQLKEALKGVNFTFIDPTSREFLKLALAEGAHLKNPPRMHLDRWVKKRNIFGIYILSHATLEEVCNIYSISGERVRQISGEVLSTIWTNSSPQLQNQYPLEVIKLDKTLEYRPKEWLLLENGLGTKIVEALEQGQTPNQIKQQFPLGYKRRQSTESLRMLRDLGFDVKRLKKAHGENARIGQELQKDNLSDQEVQDLLNQIVHDGRPFSDILAGAVISAKELLRNIGFHYKIDRDIPLFYDVLKQAGIPIGRVENIIKTGPQHGTRYYYVIATQHQTRAETALKNAPTLARFLENSVKQVAGPTSEIPTTTILAKKLFVRIGHLFPKKTSGFRKIKQSDQLTQILTTSPVPVFYYQTNDAYVCAIEDQEVLKDHIQKQIPS